MIRVPRDQEFLQGTHQTTQVLWFGQERHGFAATGMACHCAAAASQGLGKHATTKTQQVAGGWEIMATEQGYDVNMMEYEITNSMRVI